MTDFVDRFIRSCRIIKASYKVLDADGELLFLPILSGIVTAVVGGGLIYQSYTLGTFDALKDGDAAKLQGIYVWLFGFYVVEYFIIYFFNTALVGAAIARLDGGDPTVGSALALAFRRTWQILGYAIISATVGIILRMVAERIGFVGRLIAAGLGLAWTVATFLVVPVMAAEGVGPIEAIEKSAALLKKSWGENLIGNASISVVFGSIGAAVILVGYGGGLWLHNRGNDGAALLLAIACAMLLAAVAILGSALAGVYQAAVYYFTVIGEPPDGFDKGLIRDAFAPKATS
ncbi:MAG: DUF6159 family protein [Bauldia sp.]